MDTTIAAALQLPTALTSGPILTTIAVCANVLGASMALPQAARIRRTRQVAGVSPTWAMLSLVVNSWWAIYGIGVADLAITPVSIISATAYLYICIALVRADRPARASAGTVLAALVGLVPIAVLVVGGWAATGLVLGLLYAVQLAPAVVEVYRSHDVSGVSGTTWAIGFLEAILWGWYGLPRGDAGLVALSLAGATMTGLVIVRLFVRRAAGAMRSSNPSPHLRC